MGSYCVMSTAAWDDDKVLKMNSVDGCIMMWMCFMPLNCTLKNAYNGKFYVYFTMILKSSISNKKKGNQLIFQN